MVAYDLLFHPGCQVFVAFDHQMGDQADKFKTACPETSNTSYDYNPFELRFRNRAADTCLLIVQSRQLTASQQKHVSTNISSSDLND